MMMKGDLTMRLRAAILIGLLTGHIIGWLALPTPAFAVSSSVVISELQTGGVGSGHAGDEFIELYNPSAADISLEKWTLKYRSTSASDCATGWATKYTFPQVTIKSYGYFLVAATGYLTKADARYSAGLSSTAGAIRLIDNNVQVIDTLGWGTVSVCAEGGFAVAPGDGRSLERRPGVDDETGGNATDSDDNAADFIVRVVPQPQDATSPIETPADQSQYSPAAVTYLPLEITEALVDPVSPHTDTHDEYIELRNANAQPIQVNNYVLKVGTASFHLPPAVLLPDSYLVVSSADSHLTLANDGGIIQLFDPIGELLDSSAPWTTAVPGATWALFPDGWAWTATSTAGAQNIFTDTSTPDVSPSPSPSPASEGVTPTPINYLPLQINELLPDPASPATDATDEFVELYNPNSESVNIAGYIVKTGSALGNKVVLPQAIIAPGAYLSVTSGDTSLTLANAGSSVALFDPAGVQLGATIVYTTALTGDAWAIGSDGWTWTTTPTPSAPNIITVPVSKVVTAAGGVTTPTPKPSKSPKAAKVAKVKAASVKAISTKKVATKKTSSPAKVLADARVPHESWLLFALAGLTIGYIVYEFRYDLRNYYHRLRGYPASGGDTGQTP